MGWLAARRQKQRVRTATLFTTLLDFSQPGELGIFIHEPIIAALEAQNETKGIMDGRQLAVSFSLLRRTASTGTTTSTATSRAEPGGLRSAALEQRQHPCGGQDPQQPAASSLSGEPAGEGELKIRNTRIDLAKVKTPVLLVSAVDDHIALWQGTWQGMKLFGGEQRFILAESGHIAGIINPPAANKYGFWQSEAGAESPRAGLLGRRTRADPGGPR